MHRTKANSYYWLLLASFVTVLGCGDEDDEETTMEPGVVEDAGSTSDAAMMASEDAGVDGATAKPDAAVQPGKDAGSTPADASTADASTTTDSGTLEPPAPSFERGKALAEDLNCASCHRNDYAGFSLYPNITPHPTNGIGSWSDVEITAAITKGTGKDGVDLCSLMMQYDLSAAEIADLIAFLRGIPAVDKAITGVCGG